MSGGADNSSAGGPRPHRIDATTALYGIFGDPVEHSLSPLIHNTIFGEQGINAVYLAFRVERSRLGLAVEAMRSMGMRGANITIPHKEQVLQYLDEIPEDVDRCIGAINTIVNRDGRLYGYNTDGAGFLQSLRLDLGMDIRSRAVLMLGAGGSGRGVAAAMAAAGAGQLHILNRTPDRAHGLAEYLAGYFPETDIEAVSSIEELQGERLDLVVNTTSLGMKPGDSLPVDLKRLGGHPKVYDLVYAPAQTPLLKQAAALGLERANGIGMLASQAALAYGLWTGRQDGVRERMMEILAPWRR
ncbi:MAG: Shikimate dehydrogenase (NADP(+)) [Candidatus Omnitrophica bacterium]|nr:Shikimate dehydrogenase (NADP(+)) [Candidatus Omnitrophota bacterium]